MRKYSIPSLTSAAAVAVTTAATAAAVSVGGALVSTSPIIGASSLGSGGGAGSATSYSSSSSSSPSAAAASIAAGFDVSGFYGNSDANPESDEDLRSSHNHRGGQRVPPSPDFPAQLKMTLMKRAVYSTIALPRTSYRAWELEESRFVTISATSRGKSPTATTSTTRVTPAFPPLVTNHHALLFAKVVMASPTYLCEEILGKQIKELKAVVAENESLIGGGVDEDRLFIDLCLAELEVKKMRSDY